MAKITQKYVKLKKQGNCRADFVNLLISLSILISSLLLSIMFSPLLSACVKQGLELCYTTIIPVVFPFMIISDLMLSCMHFEKIGFLRKIFTRLFKINGYAISAFVCGLICGFPVGVKIANDLYLEKKISKEECETLIGFCNNPSPAFVICGIGYGLRESIRDGLVIYIISVSSAIISGILFSPKKSTSSEITLDNSFTFSLASSVNKASYNTLNICGYITLFSVILGFLKKIIKNSTVFILFSTFLEIGNSAKLISECPDFSSELSLLLICFAVSFSGFSVHLQARSMLTDNRISMLKYYLMKSTSSVMAVLMCAFYIFL